MNIILWLGGVLVAAAAVILVIRWIGNFFSNEKSTSLYYTDIAVEALHELYKKGKLSREEYDEMRKNIA